jgi:hypothetical protein
MGIERVLAFKKWKNEFFLHPFSGGKRMKNAGKEGSLFFSVRKEPKHSCLSTTHGKNVCQCVPEKYLPTKLNKRVYTLYTQRFLNIK